MKPISFLGLAGLALGTLPASAQDATRDAPTAPVLRTSTEVVDMATRDDASAPLVLAPSVFTDAPTVDVRTGTEPMRPAARPQAPTRSARDVLPQRTTPVVRRVGPSRSAREVLPQRSRPVQRASGPRRPAREVLAEHRRQGKALLAELRARPTSSVAPTADGAVVATAPPASVAARGTVQIDGPWPNPARNHARFSVTTPDGGPVRVSVFDVQGREVQVAFDGTVLAGQSTPVALDLARLAAGTYLVVVDVAGHRETKMMQVLR